MHSAVFRLILAVFVLAFAPVHAAPAPLEHFAQLRTVRFVSLSPSGKYFSVVQEVDGRDVIAIYDSSSKQRISLIAADDPSRASSVHPDKRTRVLNVEWFNDDRIVVRARIIRIRSFAGQKYQSSDLDECSVLFLNRDGTQPVGLDCFISSTLSTKGPNADTIVMQSYTFGRSSGSARRTEAASGMNVFNVNTRTGDVELRERGNSRTVSWIADNNGEVRVRIDREEGKNVFYARAPGGTEWVQSGSAPYRPWDRNDDPLKDFRPQGFTDNPNEVLLAYGLNGRTAIGVYDLAQKKISRTLFSDPKFDYGGLISDNKSRVVGAAIERWNYEQEYIDPKYKALQDEVKATFPGHQVLIAGQSDDLQRVLVRVDGPQFPGGGFVFLNFASGEAFTVANLYPNLKAEMLGKTSVISYAARDGKQIDAYLTLPQGSSGKNMPGIVMPHGGPHARDSGGFDMWTDFLANRGYSVLRPQFRGSDGFGVDHLEAGRYQWGLKMQDDVTDGVKHMIASGAWDPKRVCIFGWSYGGYAAMAGATMTPELYRCVVAGAGVSDLVRILADETGSDSDNFAAQFWRKTIGNSGTEAAKLRAASPVNLADKVVAPVLLIHGDTDITVLLNQSEFFYNALKRLNKPVEFVILKDEDHYLLKQSTRTQMMQALEGFVLKHNPPN